MQSLVRALSLLNRVAEAQGEGATLTELAQQVGLPASTAIMSDETLSRTLHQRGMPRLTPKTITTPSALRAELERVRASGYAVDDEEHAVGRRCIAAPIFDETGEAIAAISTSGPMARIVEQRLASLGALVLETASAISSEMGRPGRDAGPRTVIRS